MREPTNEKDVNVVAVARPKPDQVQTERAVDLHPILYRKPCTQVNRYLVNQVFEEAHQLLESGNKAEAS